MKTVEASVSQTLGETESGKPAIWLPVYVTGNLAEDIETKFRSLETYCKASGVDLEPESVGWIEIRIHGSQQERTND